MTVGVLYFLGFVLHVLDVMNLRLNFFEMDFIWKSWILFLLIFDLMASLGLFLRKFWGELLFIMVSLTQLFAYTVFSSFFGRQWFLIVFHIIFLTLYGILKAADFRKREFLNL